MVKTSALFLKHKKMILKIIIIIFLISFAVAGYETIRDLIKRR